jgi:hypothetical protein
LCLRVSFRRVPLWYRGKIVRYATVDAEDFERVSDYHWWWKKEKTHDGYAIARVDGKLIRMHRIIMNVDNPKIYVDHIKPQKTLDNRKENLRVCTSLQSSHNRRKYKTKNNTRRSRYRGVNKHRNGWMARMGAGKKTVYLGLYATEIEAARAYDIAVAKIDGEFYLTNNIPTTVEPKRIDRRRAKRVSSYYCVAWDNRVQRWSANLSGSEKSRVSLGTYQTELDAAKAREFAIKVLKIETKSNAVDMTDYQPPENLLKRLKEIQCR